MTDKQKGVLLALGSTVSVSIFFVPYREAGQLASRGSVVLAMLLGAAVYSTLASVRPLVRHGVQKVEWGAALAIAGITIGGNLATQFAIHEIGAGLLSALQQTQILFVTVLSVFVLRERLERSFFAGLAICVVGMLVMRWQQTSWTGQNALGMALAVGSALAFGAIQVITRKVAHQIRPNAVNAMRLWLAVGIMMGIPSYRTGLADLGQTGWLYCGLCALLGPFLGRILMMYAVRYVSAALSVLVTLVLPVFAYIVEYAFYRTTPSVAEGLGSVILMAGVFVPLFYRQRAG